MFSIIPCCIGLLKFPLPFIEELCEEQNRFLLMFSWFPPGNLPVVALLGELSPLANLNAAGGRAPPAFELLEYRNPGLVGSSDNPVEK